MRHPARLSGPQDCGAFFIDAVGPYAPDQVSVMWTDTPRQTSDEIERLVDRQWRRCAAEAEAGGVPLWNGPLCRLVDVRADADGLALTAGPTDYRTFVGTNLHNPQLRYSHGPELLANPLGLSAVVTSSDGYVVLGRRSDQVAFHARRIHPIAGCLEPAAVSDPFAALTSELIEELALSADRLQGAVCLGLVRDKRILQPELVFDVAVDAAADTIRQTHRSASGRREHAELVAVRDEPARMVRFIEQQAQILTPVGTAGLLLHGMVHWGIGWFASTRGYLHSLI